MRNGRGACLAPRNVHSTQAKATSSPSTPPWTRTDTQLLSNGCSFHHCPCTGMILTDSPPPKTCCHAESAHERAAPQAMNRDCSVLVPSPPRSANPTTALVLTTASTPSPASSSVVTTSPT